MGLYDEITCEYPLPETGYLVPEGHDEWQTKDLENAMIRYRISREGRLMRRGEKWEWVDDPDRPLTQGYFKLVDHWWVDTEYHGDVEFYDSFSLPEGGRLWAEFRARFTDGVVSNITVLELKMSPPPKREKLGGSEVDVTENAYGVEGLKIMHLGQPKPIERAPKAEG